MGFLKLGFGILLLALTLSPAMADTVLMFSADWCGNCRAAKKDMMEHKEEVIPWYLEIVDADKSKDLVKEYGVRSLPTFIYLNDKGAEVDRLVGYRSYEKLKRWVENNQR